MISTSGVISGTVESSRQVIAAETTGAAKVDTEVIVVNATLDRKDAGAPVLSANRLVGVVLSGSRGERRQAYVLPIEMVLKELDVQLVP